MVKIYDFNNNPFDPNATTRDWAWLRSIFGPDLVIDEIETKVDVDLQPGDVIYKVEWLDCKVGETSVVIHVEDMDGNPEEGKSPVFGWSSAEEHGLPETWALWTKNGVFGPTNANGDVGPSMGTGAYYDWSKGEKGPHFVWVWDAPSDQVRGIGMLTWHPDVEGNHLHVNVGYRAEIYQGEEPPEPPTDGELLEEVRRIRVATEAILEHLTGQPPAPPTDEPFRGEYFNNVDLSGEPVLVRDDPEISFSWGEGQPAPEVTANYFSVRWTGKRTFEGRTYVFKALVDDGFRLWLDDNLLIESWKDQPPTPYQASVALAAGQHDIKVEYYERAGGATCIVWWE